MRKPYKYEDKLDDGDCNVVASVDINRAKKVPHERSSQRQLRYSGPHSKKRQRRQRDKMNSRSFLSAEGDRTTIPKSRTKKNHGPQ